MLPLQKVLVLGEMPAEASPQTHLAAGPWCFAGREELFPEWERLYTFAPEPLSNPALLEKAAKQAQALCMAALPHLARRLTNSADDFLPIYWQTLLLPWAIAQASQIVERNLRIKAMAKIWQQGKLLVPLLPADENFSFQDENDFNLRGCLGIRYNWWLFSRLLENHLPKGWRTTFVKAVQPASQLSQPALSERGRKIIADFLLRLPFPRLRGMSIAESLRFSGYLLHKTKIPAAKSREELFDKPELLEEFPPIAVWLPIFIKSLPESLKKLHFTKKLNKIKTQRLKVASISAYENAQYRQMLAEWKNSGGKLAFAQHGGNYGQAKVVCNSAIVEYAEDVFFTWGWKKHGDLWGNFLPMPSPLLQRERNKWKQANEQIIFVGTEMACYCYRLESHPTPLQFLRYRQDKEIFLKACPSETRKRILYRPYFQLPGTLADAQWLKERFPEIKLCKGPLFPQIAHCSLLILDHPGTIMLEAFAAGIPTLLFWNRQDWAWTNSAEEALDQLACAGVWHKTPHEAAASLASILKDPTKWLYSTTVQKALLEYCKFQALTLKSGFSTRWQSTLLNL